MDQRLVPSEIIVHAHSRALELRYADGRSHRLPFEYLRVHSPSAEVKGHGPGQEVLQTGKRKVDIVKIEPVGAYALQPIFSDGHNTGLFSWEYLDELGREQNRLWAAYLRRLEAAGASRDG